MGVYQQVVDAVERLDESESRDEAEKLVRLYFAYCEAEGMDRKDITWILYDGQQGFSMMSEDIFDEMVAEELEMSGENIEEFAQTVVSVLGPR